MLSSAYFLAKFRFDTAENEPAKNLQNFRKMHFRKMHFRNAQVPPGVRANGSEQEAKLRDHGRPAGLSIRTSSTTPTQTLEGSSLALSKPVFGSKCSFRGFFQDLQDLHTFAPL